MPADRDDRPRRLHWSPKRRRAALQAAGRPGGATPDLIEAFDDIAELEERLEVLEKPLRLVLTHLADIAQRPACRELPDNFPLANIALRSISKRERQPTIGTCRAAAKLLALVNGRIYGRRDVPRP